MNEEVNKTIIQTFDGFQAVLVIAAVILVIYLLSRSFYKNRKK